MVKWLGIALIVIILDQITKYYAVRLLLLYQAVPVFPGFNLTLVYNTGAAFSFLGQESGWQRWFLSGFALVICVAILIWLYNLSDDRHSLPTGLGLSLVLGGAVGNLWDRISAGHVIDFIDVSLPFLPWKLFNPWPTFNIADSAITVGAMILIADALLSREMSE